MFFISCKTGFHESEEILAKVQTSLNDSSEEQTFEAAMKSIMSRKKPAKTEQKTSKNSVESHEDKIKQLLSDYSSSPLGKKWIKASVTSGKYGSR